MIQKALVTTILTGVLTCHVLHANVPPGVGTYAPEVKPSDADAIEFESAFELESRYVTEGVDNVPGSGAFLFSPMASYRGFSLGGVYVEALSDSYNEVNVFVDYSREFGPLTVVGGLNHLWYPSGAENHSWEVFVGMEWEPVDSVTLFLDSYYDVRDIDGGFLEVGVKGNIPTPDDRLELKPYGLFGVDYGFLSGSRSLRENNIQIGLRASLEVHDNAALFGHVSHSFALSNLDALGERDVTWFGGGVAVSF